VGVAAVDEFVAEGVDAIEHVGFGKAIRVADVVPGVVIQEWPVSARPFRFDESQEGTPQLTPRIGTDHGDLGDRLLCPQRQNARDSRFDAPALDSAPREGIFKAEVHILVGNGRSLHRSHDFGVRILKIEQLDAGDGQLCTSRRDGEPCLHVAAVALAQQAPVKPGSGTRI